MGVRSPGSRDAAPPTLALVSRSEGASAKVLRDLPRPYLAPVHIAFRIDRGAFRVARARELERVGYAIEDFPVAQVADADTTQPSGIASAAVRLGVSYVNEIVADVNAARTAELLPFGDECAVLIENLHAIVSAIGNVQPSPCIHGDVVRCPELDRSRAELAERLDELAVARELRDSRYGVRGGIGRLARM